MGPPADSTLTEADAGLDPIDLFRRWFAEAAAADVPLPEAMALATATPDGRPSSRMVLLKGFGPGGFVFYTNYESRKADELERNPRAALMFHWAALDRQVRIEGTVGRTSAEDAAAYFATRERESRIGAWASPQSQVLPSRAVLDELAERRREEFDGDEIPLPPFWGGYRVLAERIEFWQGRRGRLHDRLLYVRTPDGWELSRLAP